MRFNMGSAPIFPILQWVAEELLFAEKIKQVDTEQVLHSKGDFVVDYSNLCFLTEDEVKKIETWVSEKSYSLSSGYFVLRFEFSPIGDSVELWYYHEGKYNWLEVFDDMNCRRNLLRSADHAVVDGFMVNLKLSEVALAKYFQIASECTEAHLNDDCEPPGTTLSFEIDEDSCKIFADERLIEARQRS